MSFPKRHPYLFWQIIGWSLLLVDFIFVVIAVFNDFGEWCYPIIVFTFIGVLFAIIGSPFLIYFTRKSQVPDTRTSAEERVIRNDITTIVMLRNKAYGTLTGVAAVALVLVLAYVTCILGERGHILPGFISMVFMVVVPCIVCSQYLAFIRKRFMEVPDAAPLVDVREDYYLSDLRRSRIPILPLPTPPSDAMLDFLYNWLHRYLMGDRLALITLTRSDLRRIGIVLVDGSIGDTEDDIDANAPLIAIPERQLDLSGANRAQFDKECRAIGAFVLPQCEADAGVHAEGMA